MGNILGTDVCSVPRQWNSRLALIAVKPNHDTDGAVKHGGRAGGGGKWTRARPCCSLIWWWGWGLGCILSRADLNRQHLGSSHGGKPHLSPCVVIFSFRGSFEPDSIVLYYINKNDHQVAAMYLGKTSPSHPQPNQELQSLSKQRMWWQGESELFGGAVSFTDMYRVVASWKGLIWHVSEYMSKQLNTDVYVRIFY